MQLTLSHEACQQVKNASPNQTWMFVCSDFSKKALIVAAHISMELARIEARKIGGCVRVGHVVGPALARTV